MDNGEADFLHLVVDEVADGREKRAQDGMRLAFLEKDGDSVHGGSPDSG